ncbi:S8 family peptidase [Priestia megaterium]
MSTKDNDDFIRKNQNDEKNSSPKPHFLIPDSEVEKVDHSPTARPKQKQIDHASHGRELEKGLGEIKAIRRDKKTPITDDVIIFKVEISDDDKVDARGDYERIFLSNDLKVNAIKKSNVAIVSSTIRDFERLETKLGKYVESNGRSSDFFQFITKISFVDKEEKQSSSLIEDKNIQKDKQDVQITLIPNLQKTFYEKMLKYLKQELKGMGGQLIDEPYFLSNDTPVLRALLPSSGIDLLSDQEIIYRIEPTPFYTSGSNKKPKKIDVNGIELQYENDIDELPLVCILDDGVRLPGDLDNLVAGRWVAPDISRSTAEHGTKVASRAIFGDEIDKNVLEDKKLFPRVRVIDAVISAGDGNSIPEMTLINRIKKAVEEIKDITKIFNLSFNSRRPIKDEEVSHLAHELDKLMKQHGVIFIVPTGNHDLWHSYSNLNDIIDDEASRLAAPGESFLGVTVGSITRDEHQKSISQAHELSPFSRVGLGFCGTPKPDLSYPGGNVYVDNGTHYIAGNSAAYVINKEGYLEAEFGTSFAAPLAATELALLTLLVPNQDPFIAKALLLHHAELSHSMFNLHLNEADLCERMHGKGIGNYENANYSMRGRATYVRAGKMSRLIKQRVQFHMPSSISKHSKRNSQVADVKVTCLCIPPVNQSTGYEYIRAYVDTSLHCINSNGTQVTRNPAGGEGRKKWHHVHHFSQTFSTFNPGDWQIWLQLYSKPEIENDVEIDYILIVTIEDMTNQGIDVYGGIETEASGRFYSLNEVEVEVDMDDVS